MNTPKTTVIVSVEIRVFEIHSEYQTMTVALLIVKMNVIWSEASKLLQIKTVA